MKMFNLFFALAFLLLICSCKKYLNAKPDKKLAVPSSLTDVQALLDNDYTMNNSSPSLGEISADNYYLDAEALQSMSAQEQNAYLRDSAIYYGGFPNDWSSNYNPVYYANVALEYGASVERTLENATAWDNVKGSALFYRAKSFLQGLWIWAKAYDASTAEKDLGIPLRLSSDFTAKSIRANVKTGNDQVITDLTAAAELLPVTPLRKMRPSKPAAYAMLARAYLSMRVYDSCLKYAGLSLQLFNKLTDYNSIDATADKPFTLFGPEVIFHSMMDYPYQNLLYFYAKVDTVLYRSFAPNDLRKTVFFGDNADGSHYFKGSYAGFFLFNGLATDEVLLMHAECLARKGQLTEAYADLNTLLKARWKTGTYTPLVTGSQQSAIDKILLERRKELLFRDLRWMDIKRLNKEGAEIVLKRMVNGVSYLLPPNDNRFALPIPPDIIALTGMEQNRR